MSKELKYENDVSTNRKYYYINVNYVHKKQKFWTSKNIITKIKISLEGLNSRFELIGETGNMKRG